MSILSDGYKYKKKAMWYLKLFLHVVKNIFVNKFVMQFVISHQLICLINNIIVQKKHNNFQDEKKKEWILIPSCVKWYKL